ncbi:hypothetical protein [Phaeobacter sp. NW0010-22]|uniref:hypothetical protein n=1 Tax=Phaeobacter sp. NW0010-22 TaxID=3135907 RepID=UPI00333EA1D3
MVAPVADVAGAISSEEFRDPPRPGVTGDSACGPQRTPFLLINCWLKDDALEHPLLAGTVRGAMAVVGATERVVFCVFGATVVVAIVGTGLRVVLAAVVAGAVVVRVVVVVVRVVVVVLGLGAATVVAAAVFGLGCAFGLAGAAVGPDGLVITVGAAACLVVDRADPPATAVGLYPHTCRRSRATRGTHVTFPSIPARM